MHIRMIGLLGLVSMAAATTGVAHHSHANYVESEFVNLRGAVVEIHWMNPHSWIYLQVASGDGHDGAWALEGASVTTLRQNGWTPDSIAVGKEISVRCHPLKDGSRGCLLGYIALDDGTEKEFD